MSSSGFVTAARHAARSFRFVLLITAMAVLAYAQQTRAVSGTVRDGEEVVRGAVVQIENLNTLEVRSYITQRDGTYHFAQLSTNTDYQVWAQRDDKRSQKKMLSKFDSGLHKVIDLVLK